MGETYGSVSSPVGDKAGNVFFADPAANRIYKSDPDRKMTVFKDNSNGADALGVGPDGRLYAAQRSRQQIVARATSTPYSPNPCCPMYSKTPKNPGAPVPRPRLRSAPAA